MDIVECRLPLQECCLANNGEGMTEVPNYHENDAESKKPRDNARSHFAKHYDTHTTRMTDTSNIGGWQTLNTQLASVNVRILINQC